MSFLEKDCRILYYFEVYFQIISYFCKVYFKIYYKHGNVDLDFYIPEAKMAVQASYSIQDDTTRIREVSALVDFNKAFKLRKAVIVTYDEEETIEKDGLTIEVIPVWKWLLR